MIREDTNFDKQTFVEEGTEFKGTLTSSCPVAVRGTLDGDIKAPMLTITETGTVTGNVEAKSIRSEGVLAGKVDADDIFLSGQVRDNTIIRARSLEVKLEQEKSKLEVTFGECVLEVGDDPNIDMKGKDEDSKDKFKEDSKPMASSSSSGKNQKDDLDDDDEDDDDDDEKDEDDDEIAA